MTGFTNPGTRAHARSVGNQNIQETLTVGANLVSVNSTVMVMGTLPNTSLLSPNLSIQVANSTSQTVILPTGINIGANIIINTTSLFIGNSTANMFANSTTIEVQNSTSSFIKTPISMSIGNSTANNYGNSTIEILANSSGQTVSTPISISMGNSTANNFANSIFEGVINATANTQITPGTITLAGAGSNQGLVLGLHSFAGATSNTAGSNGYTFLPNGLLMQWGAWSVSSTSANVIFKTPFPTACFSVVVTHANSTPVLTANTAGTYIIKCSNISTSNFSAITGNTTSVLATYIAVGN